MCERKRSQGYLEGFGLSNWEKEKFIYQMGKVVRGVGLGEECILILRFMLDIHVALSGGQLGSWTHEFAVRGMDLSWTFKFESFKHLVLFRA